MIGAAAASAATTYHATSNEREGAGAHSLWFASDNSPTARPLGALGSRPNHFKFENRMPSYGVFAVDGSTATLTGEVANANGQAFKIDLSFVAFDTSGGNFGLKRLSSNQDVSDWTLYELDRSKQNTISFISGTGTGAALQSFDVALRGSNSDGDFKVQVGTGANDKDANKFGLSTWITLTDQNGASNCGFAICRYNGDINIVLEQQPPNNNPPAVPLPAAGYMLIAGLGGMFVMRRRQRAA